MLDGRALGKDLKEFDASKLRLHKKSKQRSLPVEAVVVAASLTILESNRFAILVRTSCPKDVKAIRHRISLLKGQLSS